MPQLKAEGRIAYPPESKKKSVQGDVVMDLLIDTMGKVREATLVEGPNQELSQAALAAAKGFQFSPAMIREKPVAVKIRFIYHFVLER
jgi:TonB family protein